MHIHISPRNLKLTAAIHAYVAEKVSHLEHISNEVIAAHVVIWHDDTRSPSKAFCVKVHLAVPGPDLHAEEHNADMYAAIDKVAEKLARQLRKRKTRIKDQVKQKTQKAREQAKKRGTLQV